MVRLSPVGGVSYTTTATVLWPFTAPSCGAQNKIAKRFSIKWQDLNNDLRSFITQRASLDDHFTEIGSCELLFSVVWPRNLTEMTLNGHKPAHLVITRTYVVHSICQVSFHFRYSRGYRSVYLKSPLYRQFLLEIAKMLFPLTVMVVGKRKSIMIQI